MIWQYAKKNYLNYSWKERIGIVAAFCTPYIVIAVLLMLYNYARFDNPFEFGQSYQLTLVDQHFYMDEKPMFGPGWLANYLNDILFYFVKYTDVSSTFPYIHEDGLFVLFPVLLIGAVAFRSTKNDQKTDKFVPGLCAAILLVIFVIILMQSRWAPYEHRRYSMDFNFMFGILLMFGVCRIFMDIDEAKYMKVNWLINFVSIAACIVSIMLFFTTGESAMSDIDPSLPGRVAEFLFFWK